MKGLKKGKSMFQKAGLSRGHKSIRPPLKNGAAQVAQGKQEQNQTSVMESWCCPPSILPLRYHSESHHILPLGPVSIQAIQGQTKRLSYFSTPTHPPVALPPCCTQRIARTLCPVCFLQGGRTCSCTPHSHLAILSPFQKFVPWK